MFNVQTGHADTATCCSGSGRRAMEGRRRAREGRRRAREGRRRAREGRRRVREGRRRVRGPMPVASTAAPEWGVCADYQQGAM